MNQGKNKFIPLQFNNVYIAGRFVHLFTKDLGYQGQDPRYCITILVPPTNSAYRQMLEEVENYKSAGKMRQNAIPLMRTFDELAFSQEHRIFTAKGVDVTKFKTMLLKNRNEQIPLYSPDGQSIPYIKKNEKFFTRGTKINAKVIMGNHMGQPFTILTGIQYVDKGYSDQIVDSTYNVAFDKLENTAIPADMVLGNTVTITDDYIPPVESTPDTQAQDMEEALNNMLADKLRDDEEVPF